MRAYSIPAAVVFALVFALASRAAEKPRPAQNSQNQIKKVWTDEDLDQLHSRGLISIVGLEAGATTRPAAESTAPAHPRYASRLQDPEWYAASISDLQSELDKRVAALDQQKTALALAADRITMPGISLDKTSAGVTPQAGVAILEAQVQDIQNQIDELADLARQNRISPENALTI